jgi:photosystem II stability/assembly factor-like uncharacterized protein
MKKLLLVSVILILGLWCNLLNAQTGWAAQIHPLGIGDTAIIGKVQFVSPTEGWISGGLGDLLHTTNAGANWIVVTPFPDDSVWCSSDPDVSMSWVNTTHGWKINSYGPEYGTSYGVVVHPTTDGGNTWQKKDISTSPGDFGFQIQFVDINIGWLLVFNFDTQVATFLKTTDGGNNWVPFNGAGIFYFVDANNGWSYYGSGQNGYEPPFKILRTTNGGTDWTEQFTDTIPGGYNEIHFSEANNGWLVGDSGKVIKTTDGGANWNYVTNSGINPDERSKDVFFLDANTGWISSKDISGHAFLQQTTDGGANWTTHETFPGDGSIYSIYFYDAQNGWVTGFDPPRIYHFTGTTNVEENNNIPIEFSLSQNYPNPFNPSTRIQYSINNREFVSLKVYDVLGNEIATLVNEEKQAGSYETEFNALQLSSGMYFYKLTSGSFTETKKMILMK